LAVEYGLPLPFYRCTQICKRGRITHWVDGRDRHRSNWLRFINCAASWETQNVAGVQKGGDIYYRTVQSIPPDTELLVWYGDDYAFELGLISVRFSRSLDTISLCKSLLVLSFLQLPA